MPKFDADWTGASPETRTKMLDWLEVLATIIEFSTRSNQPFAEAAINDMLKRPEKYFSQGGKRIINLTLPPGKRVRKFADYAGQMKDLSKALLLLRRWTEVWDKIATPSE